MNKPQLLEKYQLLIGGQWRDASDGATFTTKCPANGEVLASCAQATRSDVDDAVNAAWKHLKPGNMFLPVSGRRF